MITFKQFITESKSAPLYHATGMYSRGGGSFGKIILTNKLLASTDTTNKDAQRYNKPSVFFTRSLSNAHTYGSRAFMFPFYVIFEIDQLKLSQRYSIEPVHNWSNEYYKKVNKRTRGYIKAKQPFGKKNAGVEFEEVIDRDIKNFLQYVTKIHHRFEDKNTMFNNITSEMADILNKYPSIQYKSWGHYQS